MPTESLDLSVTISMIFSSVKVNITDETEQEWTYPTNGEWMPEFLCPLLTLFIP